MSLVPARAGHDYHRDVAGPAQLPGDFKTVHAGQQEVDKYDVRAALIEVLQPVLSALSFRYGIPLLAQEHAERGADVGVVFDQQDVCSH